MKGRTRSSCRTAGPPGARAAARRPWIRALALMALGGCSWAFVHKAPTPPIPLEPFATCTESVAAPILDTVGAASMLAVAAGGGFVLSLTCLDWNQTGHCPTAALAAIGALPGAALAVVYGFSAWYGYRHTAACRELLELQRACLGGDPRACRRIQEDPGAPSGPATKEDPGSGAAPASSGAAPAPSRAGLRRASG